MYGIIFCHLHLWFCHHLASYAYLSLWLVRGAAQLLRAETEQQSTNKYCTLPSAPTVRDLQEEGYLQEMDMGIGKKGDRRSTKVRAELPTLTN